MTSQRTRTHNFAIGTPTTSDFVQYSPSPETADSPTTTGLNTIDGWLPLLIFAGIILILLYLLYK